MSTPSGKSNKTLGGLGCNGISSEGTNPSGVGAGDRGEIPSAGVLFTSSERESTGEDGKGSASASAARDFPFGSDVLLCRLTCLSILLRMTGRGRREQRWACTSAVEAPRNQLGLARKQRVETNQLYEHKPHRTSTRPPWSWSPCRLPASSLKSKRGRWLHAVGR